MDKIKNMDKIKRAVHLDFHTMPGIYNFGEGWDAAKFAKTLSDAHVTCINAFAQCNLGFSYYSTKIGVPYPNMKFDLFGSLLSECHKVGIKVIAYISVGLNHEQSRLHAEWCNVDSEGRILRSKDSINSNFFRILCYNTGYREYLLAAIKEILSYDVDGIFCDSVISRPCYCNNCVERMIKNGIDITNEDEVLKFSYDTMLDIAKDIRDVVPKDKYLYLNGIPFEAKHKWDSHVEVECLPAGNEGYDFFPATAAYTRNLYDNVVYMTGRFHASWGDFGGIKTKASIENDLFDALCNNFQISVGDHMHPARNLENSVYKTLGEVYEKMEKYEKWVDDTTYFSDIGVIRNKDTYKRGWMSFEYKGIARMLSELKYSFDIINEDMDFERFKLIILPDNVEMTEKLKLKLQEHLNAGKKVIASGYSGLNSEHSDFELKDWDFIKVCGVDENPYGYYHIDNNEMDYAMYTESILMETEDSNTILAKRIKPYFDRHWDGMHGYFYTPPDKESGCAVVMKNNVCHISFKIFEAYNKNAAKFHKDLVKSIIEQMLPNPILKADNMPSTSRVTATGTDNYTLVHVKVTYPEPRGKANIIEEHNVLPEGHEISLRGKYTSVKLLPSESDVEFSFENGYTTFKLPQIVGYEMFLVQ